MSQPIVVDKYSLQPEYCQLPEGELIARCQSGDLEAFNVLISRYEHRVLNLAYRFLRDYHQALDAAQEIFIKLFRKIKSYQGKSSFNTWLYRVTSNHCLNILAKKNRSFPCVSLDAVLENQNFQNMLDEKAQPPDAIYADQELCRLMAEAIEHLPPLQRQAIILQHYENLSHEQIAEIMQTNVSTINSCLHRARQRLKKYLRKQGGGNYGQI